MSKKTTIAEIGIELSENQKRFCLEYVIDRNATRAYKAAFNEVADASARVMACNLLTNLNIMAYIDHLNRNTEEVLNITKIRVIQEHIKLAFSNIGKYHNTWISKVEFEQLSDEEKAAISEISTKVIKLRADGEDIGEEEYVKIKLHDKQKSLESIAKLMGYDSPQTLNIINDNTSQTREDFMEELKRKRNAKLNGEIQGE